MTAWLTALMAPTARQLGHPVRMVDAFDGPVGDEDLRLRQALCGDDESFHGWVRSSLVRDVPPDLHSVLSAALGDDLIVGGIPLWLQGYLNAAGQPFVSFDISPLRFMPDLALNVATNIPSLAAAIKRSVVAENLILDAAAVLAARARADRVDQALRPFSGCAVVFGQTEEDLSLISGGSLVDPAAGALRALEAAADFPHLLFKPHPYATTDGMLPFLAAARSVGVVRGPAYAILASGEVDAAIAISSGVLKEAPYFGKKAIQLFDRDIDRIALAGVERIDHAGPRLLLGAGLRQWLPDVLRHGVDAKLDPDCLDVEPSAAGLTLRATWPYDWGFRDEAPISIELHAPQRPQSAQTVSAPMAASPEPVGQGEWRALGLDAPEVSAQFGGFTPRYEQGRWMVEPWASLAFELDRPIIGRGVVVGLRLRIIPSPKVPSQTLTIRAASGRALLRRTLDKPYDQVEEITLRLQRSEVEEGRRVRLALSTSALVDLKAEGLSGDGQPLGPCIVAIRVDPWLEIR